MIDFEELAQAMGDLDEDIVKELLEQVMSDGGTQAQAAMDACQKGMDIVGSRFEEGDIGKNIVRSMLEAAGFEVLDLGIDVPAVEVVKAAKENNIKIVALSGVLTLAIDSMKDTIQAFKDAGLEDVKIIIGGAPVSESACKLTGADEWAHSPQKTVAVCKAWAEA